ncbi:MAG: hypothetical protein QGM46_01210 [Actinomycetota bacterium]|nr:hypothetical protein [Actinomycetota bacterium]MDK1095753.1 hypothetical protein [Actinomycetota bacterium]MDK1290963.1 hypothetical protein [Actinomycetota bacterium]
MLFQTIPGIDEIIDVDSVTGWDVTAAIAIIDRTLPQAGIVIAFPQGDVWLRTSPDTPKEKKGSR